MGRQMATVEREWIPLPEAAQLIGCAQDVLRKRIDRGGVKARRVGFAEQKRRREVHRSEIERLKSEYVSEI